MKLIRTQLLRKFEYFGQYGKIAKVVVNRHNIYNAESPLGPSVSAYVTYFKKEDAARAIMFANGAVLDNRQLK
jgi:CCR4-NOT transcription complex subunit 4